MARNGSGVYSLPAGSTVANGDTSDASDLNSPLADLEADMNTPRPVVAGGTGVASVSAFKAAFDLETGVDILAYDVGLQQIADLADPNADRLLFWDDSASAYTYLTVGTNLTLSGTTLSAESQAPADGSITFAKLADAAVVDATETLFDNDSDTAFPTAAAMIDALGSYLIVADEKTSGTGGGSSTTGSWVTRTLNTVRTNTISGASLSSNQITLPAGTYRINASAPGLRIANFSTRLRNITDSTDTLIGTSEQSEQSGAIVQSRSHIVGTFTIAGTKAFEIQMQCGFAFGTVGYGNPAGFGTEVYTIAEIQRIA